MTDPRRNSDPRIIRGVLVMGCLGHMLAMSRRASNEFESEGGDWTELNLAIQAVADTVAYRAVLESIPGTDAARMLAKVRAYWPRVPGPEIPDRLLRSWRLAETLVGEFVQELAQRPVSFPCGDGASTTWANGLLTREEEERRG